jgi:hypothetical protein
MTGFELDSSPNFLECFEKLYALYDDNFKPSKDLYLTKIYPQKSLASTCEPTPTNFVDNKLLKNKKGNILENNQNIMNDSFVDQSKSKKKRED